MALEQTRFIQLAAQVDSDVFWSLFPTDEEYLAIRTPYEAGIRGWTEERETAFLGWLGGRGVTYDEFLVQWQNRFRLPNDWCTQCAKRTIARDWPGPRKPPDADIPTFGIMEGPSVPQGYLYNVTPFPEEAIPGFPETRGRILWAPERESWEELEARVIAALREKRDIVLKELEEHRPAHNKPTPYRNSWHMLWLTDYVVGRQSTYQLALRYWREELAGWEYSGQHRNRASTVYKGIKSAAKNIRLTLPPRTETR